MIATEHWLGLTPHKSIINRMKVLQSKINNPSDTIYWVLNKYYNRSEIDTLSELETLYTHFKLSRSAEDIAVVSKSLTRLEERLA